jgi:hypothetical protein
MTPLRLPSVIRRPPSIASLAVSRQAPSLRGHSPGRAEGSRNDNFMNGEWTADAIEERRWLRRDSHVTNGHAATLDEAKARFRDNWTNANAGGDPDQGNG